MAITVRTEGIGPSAVFALPWLVADERGYFASEGISVEFVENRAEQVLTQPVEDHGLVDSIRNHVPFEEGRVDLYRACEWGQIRRAHDSRRGARIIGKRSSVAVMALMAAPGSKHFYPQTLANEPVAVSFHNGNHYAAIQMLEGFLETGEIKTVGYHTIDGYRAVRSGEAAAVALSEPWIALAEKQGFQKVIETHYAGLELASPDFDRDVYAACNRAIGRAVADINADKRRYLHYLIDSLPEVFRGEITPDDFHLPRLRYVQPEPYTRVEFEKAYSWMLRWGLIEPGSRYEDLVIGDPDAGTVR
ncbi:ABC transporter substrate-binding protein [Streptomyces sp. DH37]|uniref:ABC transporter substrate-binding protein n=1 Tax=Streptomyces sp. DH37 TaxID=3040122 RepID=UPI00244169B9|nr:ABC transporter substrate-binding protein [Streptomyces sp. DH37]MDG9701983.1 ABC transporter substrate-binding protein [Streptomyces sp. DH37]